MQVEVEVELSHQPLFQLEVQVVAVMVDMEQPTLKMVLPTQVAVVEAENLQAEMAEMAVLVS
jgi:hypothetical protein